MVVFVSNDEIMLMNVVRDVLLESDYCCKCIVVVMICGW